MADGDAHRAARFRDHIAEIRSFIIDLEMEAASARRRADGLAADLLMAEARAAAAEARAAAAAAFRTSGA